MAKKNTSTTYDPSPAEHAKAGLITSRYELARMNQQPYWTDFDRYYKLYESYVNENKEIFNTKMFVPIIFSVIERFLPRLISSKPTVNFMPRRPDTVDRAQHMQSLFEWQWDQVSRVRDGGMYMELLRFVKEALITGTAIAKIPWRVESREKKYYNDKGAVAVKFDKYFDGPDFQLVDPYDFFYDPESVDIQQASWVIHRTRRTLDEMRAINKSKGVEIYKNLNLLEEKPADTLINPENDWKYRRKVALGGAQTLVADKTTKKHELMECWGYFPVYDENGQPKDDESVEQRVIVLADKSVVVRDIEFPYWHGKKPFVSYTPWPRSFEFYGIPIIKHLERIQFYTNEFVNQKFDNQTMSLNQMIVVDPLANLEDWQLVWRPGGVIRAHPEYIQPLALGDVTPNIDASLNYLSQTAQLTTGLSDYYTSGVNPEQTSNKTATGTNTIEEQMAARVKEAVQVLEEQVIREIGYQWHGLDGQFIKLPLIIRVIGPSGKPEFPLVEPEDTRYSYDVIPEQGSTEPINKALLRNQFIQALQMVSSNPLMAQITDWHTTVMEMWKMFGQKQPEKLMTSTPGSDPKAIGGQEGDQPSPGGPPPPLGGPPRQGIVPSAPNMPQMLAQAMNGQQQRPQFPGPGAPPQQGTPQGPQGSPGGPGGEAAKLPGTVSTKLADLTLAEQKQWLEKLGIQADLASRTEQFAHTMDQQKADRQMKMMQMAKSVNPISNG